jgi:hypothetical protein
MESLSALIDIAQSQHKDLEAAISMAIRAAVGEPNLKEAMLMSGRVEGGQAEHHIE